MADPLRTSRVWIFILVLTLYILAIAAFFRILDTLLLGVAAAVVVMPLRRWIGRRFTVFVSASIATTLVFLAILVFILGILGILYQNRDLILRIAESIEAGWADLVSGGLLGMPLIPQDLIASWLNRLTELAGSTLERLVFSIPDYLVEIAIFFFSLYLFLLHGEEIWGEILGIVPGRMGNALQQIGRTVSDTLYAVFVVDIGIAVVTFFIAAPFLYILGYDHVIFFSFVLAVSEVLPVVGPSFVIVVLAILDIFTGNLARGIVMLVAGYLIVAAFPDLFLRPVLMGNRAGISPVIMFIAIFGGLYALGAIGFVFGPLIASIVLAGYRVLVDELKTPEGG
ncbi:MAG: AI-2E family transporter [Methanomicrobiales archaeon]|nr:AI-2E family transporter [Methanomicrobiales archaeon]MDI6876559.1 AI-2E family transporter [Methanomicrobiales archaeon]